MPEPVEKLVGAVKHEDTVEITWEFKANLSDLTPEWITLDAPESVPLPGTWKLQLKYQDNGTDKIRVRVFHGSLPVGAFGSSVVVTLRFALVLGTDKRQLHVGSWNDGSEPSLQPKPPTSYTAYAFTVLRSGLAANGRWPASEQNSVQQYSYSFHTWHADVCLRFRRPDDVYLKLWTTSGLLATASDYYKTLLASGCAETVPSGSKRKRKRSEAPPPIAQKPSRQGSPAQPTIDWQDSDDETDNFLVERDWSGCKTASCDSVDMEYQQIDVRETAYSTMNAVLLYLASALLNKHVSEHPKLPPPVSPKSVYRLAHLLQREELQQLALDALSTSLTTDGAARELFGPVSIAYADVKKVVLDYVVENWQEVQASKSWNEMREKATTGEIEGAAQILFDLLSTLQEKDLIRATPKKQT